MENLLGGLELLLQPAPILYLVAGVSVGFVVGVLPGFSGANAAALALSFSLGLSMEIALILMSGIYAGASFSGAIPAILMNVPGTAGAAATALDGYPMARSGKAELAIGIARMASVLGGVIGITIVLSVIGPLSRLALTFGAREMFVVAVFGLAIIATVMGESFRKGAVAALMGLLIASMAASPVTGQPRFTMGFLGLYEAVPFVPAVIGLFAFSQMFFLMTDQGLSGRDRAQTQEAPRGLAGQMREVWEGIKATFAHPVTVVRSAVIGVALGVVPGVGTAVGNFMSYGEAKRRSKHPELFGEGSPEGIIASEACDNAVTCGTMVPTLTLGVPGSATAAVMLGAMYLHGVEPGPRVMLTHAASVYAILLSLLFASLLILPIGILLATPLARVTRIAPAYIIPCVLVLCVVGTYAVRNSLFDVMVALAFAALGVLFRLTGYPVVPLILGLILGPIAERNFMRALALGNNDPLYFFQSPTALVMWALLVLVLSRQVYTAVSRPPRRAGGSGPMAGAG